MEGVEDLCRFSREPAEACPAFARACASIKPAATHRTARWELTPWLAELTRILFWGLLIAGAAWWIMLVVRHFREGRMPDELRAPEQKPLRPPTHAEATAPRVVDKDAARLLSAAQSALASGDAGGALVLAHAALVRALESEGYLRVHTSATNGDYARALAARPELGDLFRATAREVESSEFGRELPTLERLQQLLRRIEPVVHRLAAIALALAALSTSACQAFGPSREPPDDRPGGNAVLRELLEQRGATFERRVRPLSDLVDDEDTDLVILAPSARLDEPDGALLEEWVRSGGTLMIVGRHSRLPPDFGMRGYSAEICTELPRSGADVHWGTVKIVPFERPLDLDQPWTTEIACSGRPLMATRNYGDGRIIAVADPDFLTNASLAHADHAWVFFALAGEVKEVSMIDRLVSAGASSPYRALLNSGLAPLLGHGLVWVVLWALANGATFGVRRDPPEPPRRAFSEHVRAVGRLYARAGAQRHALAVYAAWALDRLNSRLRPGGGAGVTELGSAIARVTGRPEADVARILSAAAEARDRPDGVAKAEDLGVLAALDDIVHETGGHR